MRVARGGLCAALLLSFGAAAAHAQDAGRGSALYRSLPGSPAVGSCVSCHGEPVNNRNSVLRGAGGAAVIARTISAVGAMGYLRQYLSDADLADIASYLASVVPAGAIDALPELSPTADLFGTQQVATASGERTVLLRNRLPGTDVSIGAVLSVDIDQFALRHDCPLVLPPLAQCSIHIAFRPHAAGPIVSTFSVVDSGGQLLRTGAVSGIGTTHPTAVLTWRQPPDFRFGNVRAGRAAHGAAGQCLGRAGTGLDAAGDRAQRVALRPERGLPRGQPRRAGGRVRIAAELRTAAAGPGRSLDRDRLR